MPRSALKVQIVVEAGVIPGQPQAELTRTWHLTNDVIEACEADPADYRYMDICGAAMNYAANLQNPNRCNWVSTNWMWL